jgi:hypothetical protein
MIRARLLKVMVQPMFVIDDDELLQEVIGTPVEIPAATWRNFAVSAFDEQDLAAVLEQFHAQLRDDASPA